MKIQIPRPSSALGELMVSREDKESIHYCKSFIDRCENIAG